MSLYRDSTTRIDGQGIELKGLILPRISLIKISNDEIKNIEVINLSIFKKLNLLGSNDLKTWWTFDSSRPFKKSGFVISLKEGKYKIGFTVSEFHDALEVLFEQFGDRILDLRS